MASKSISLAKFIQSSPTLLKLVKPVANAYANAAGYRQMGLRYDDLLTEENHQTQKREGYDRAYRMRRAVQCSIVQRPLPKEQWTKVEEDVRYLSPLVEQVQAADDERVFWDTVKVQKK